MLSVLATTYKRRLEELGSITGVPVIPINGEISLLVMSRLGAGTACSPVGKRLVFQSGGHGVGARVAPKGKDAFFLGRYEDDVPRSAPGNGEVSNVKRLCIGITIQRAREKPAKRRRS